MNKAKVKSLGVGSAIADDQDDMSGLYIASKIDDKRVTFALYSIKGTNLMERIIANLSNETIEEHATLATQKQKISLILNIFSVHKFTEIKDLTGEQVP